MAPAADLVLACVHYRRPAETERFVLSALEQVTTAPLRIIVVDNSPAPDEQAVPASLRNSDRIRILDPGANLGYFGAAALALHDHMINYHYPTWFFLSNPDIRFIDSAALEKLSTLHLGKEPGVLAPSIRSTQSGIDQNPYMRRRPSSTRMQFYRWMFSTYPSDALYQYLHLAKRQSQRGRAAPRPTSGAEQPEQIYAAHGSFLALHQSYFERGGTLGHGAFLFGEEVYVAETARRLGLAVLFDPRVRLEHAEHTSTGAGWNRRSSDLRREASRYLAKTFF